MKKLFLIIVSVFLTLNSVSALSETEQINAANYLAKIQIINDFSGATDQYKINDNISRKEVMKIIINSYEWYKWDITWTYKCLWKYKDVVDDWGCKYIEKSLIEWFIEKWESFRPDESISISETLKLIFKVKKIEKKYNTWDWQKDYIDTAYDLWLIYDKNINWTIEAKRWFIFLTLANAYNYESFQGWDLVAENKTDFYWIDFSLKIVSSNKYEINWENVSKDIDSIEILSCKENFSDVYDLSWYKLKSFKMWNSSFKYSIDKNFNNYCVIPYKIKLNYASWDTKTVDLNLNLLLFRKFTDKNIAELWYPNNINLNTLGILKSNYEKSQVNLKLIDKNNLYVFHRWWPENYALYYRINDYLSYKYVWDILIWDNYAFDVRWKNTLTIGWNTFEKFWTGYYKDKDNYYIGLYKIWNNNKSLNIISEVVYNYDWKYYYFDKKIEVWEPSTFTIVSDDREFENNLAIYTIFAKDKDNIYIERWPLWKQYEGKFKWDYDSYKILNHNMAIDKYSLFFGNWNWKLVQYPHTFDIQSLKVIENKTFSDKNWEYYIDEEKWIIKK